MAVISQIKVANTGYYFKGVRLDTVRQTSADLVEDGSALMTHFLATSAMTTSKPSTGDGHIIQLNWDGTNGYDTQLYIRNTNTPQMRMRGQSAKEWGNWIKVYSENDKPSLSADVTGTLPIANGGTGQTTVANAINYLLQNGCTVGSSTPSDNDTYIASYADGKNKDGTGTNTFHRRPLSALWAYIKGKTDATYLPLAGGTMSGQIQKAGVSTTWINGRSGAALRVNTLNGYSATLSSKSTDGSWEYGVYTGNKAYFTYCTDTNFSAGTNSVTKQYMLDPSGATGWALRNISYGTGAPSGGSNGDMYIQYS